MEEVSREDLGAKGSLWRYSPLLPPDPDKGVTLGEGWTPLRRIRSDHPGVKGVEAYIKDEGVSPTGTFKARGMAVAVSMAAALGNDRLVVPSAGNAGVALAAYATAAGLEALVVAPRDTPQVLLRETIRRGARCILVRGDLGEAGEYAEIASDFGYLNLATLREPYRVEGKKTMGYEVWEQLGKVPDWLVFPTGGGTGVVGLWKAFRELGELGWTDGSLPRLCAVQSDGCAPLAAAWREGRDYLPDVREPRTVATGLRVPHPAGYRLVLRAVRDTNGVILSVPEGELIDAAGRMGAREGIYPCFEGAAAYLGFEALVREKRVGPGDQVVVFNTGLGLINPETVEPDLPIVTSREDLVAYLGG